MERNEGILFVLSGPSGVGKGTVREAIMEGRNETLHYSISVTTRKPRDGEIDGVDYFFKSKVEFEQMIKNNELLEWAEYVGNYYGTPIKYVQKMLKKGNDVLLEIEVQGAMQVKQNFPNAVFIFLMPPSLTELKNRITNRGTEEAHLIENRMSVAKEEIQLMTQYDYVVENDEVEAACHRIQAIICAEHYRKDRLYYKYKNMLEVE
ncbi:guanylate kinase [Pueribacillus sp. YX66]|uniref:guanylate kinase n=1 Tax=Pueribacillus sp. YX66 TaxID=3229242 RepID=UPI00358D1655